MERIYSPSNNLLEGIQNLLPLEICPWDDYYMRMAQTDFLLKRQTKKASKTFFIRKAPFGGSYALLGGITAFYRTIQDFEFDDIVQFALADQSYKPEFIEYCKLRKKISVNIFSPFEGSVFCPNESVIILEGDLFDIRIAEGILLKNVNFATLSLTKWRRVVEAAAPGRVLEFSRRRAQDDIRTSIYAHLAGCHYTSNAEVRRGLNIKVVGTMGHEWIQSFGDEFESFDKWLEINPDKPVLLVDTINTLQSGLPNAIKAFKKHWEKIKTAGGIPGIRNDSGDLAFLTIEERIKLDANDLFDVLIFQTNDLDEYSIEDIKEQIYTHSRKAGIDPFNCLTRIVWACGTNPGVCSDQPSLGGVMKLTSIAENYLGHEKAVIKLAMDNPIKTSIPGNNRSAFVWNNSPLRSLPGDSELLCCLNYQKNERFSDIDVGFHQDDENKSIIFSHKDVRFEARQYYINACELNRTIDSVRRHIETETSRLHWTHKRLKNAHMIKVSLSEKLFQLRSDMISNKILIER